MRVKTRIVAVVIVMAGLGSAWLNASPLQEVEGATDLEKVERARFRETYVNTAVDFTTYSKLYLGDAYFDYRDVGPARRYRSMGRTSSKSAFGITESDRKRFEDMVDKAFTNELSKAKRFEIVDTLGPGTIYMRGALVDIVSRVPPEFVGMSEVYLSSVGDATLVMELLDGQTGEVLARVAERGRIGSRSGFSGMPANSVTINSDVKRWAAQAARKLRKELDDAMAGK